MAPRGHFPAGVFDATLPERLAVGQLPARQIPAIPKGVDAIVIQVRRGPRARSMLGDQDRGLVGLGPDQLPGVRVQAEDKIVLFVTARDDQTVAPHDGRRPCRGSQPLAEEVDFPELLEAAGPVGADAGDRTFAVTVEAPPARPIRLAGPNRLGCCDRPRNRGQRAAELLRAPNHVIKTKTTKDKEDNDDAQANDNAFSLHTDSSPRLLSSRQEAKATFGLRLRRRILLASPTRRHAHKELTPSPPCPGPRPGPIPAPTPTSGSCTRRCPPAPANWRR